MSNIHGPKGALFPGTAIATAAVLAGRVLRRGATANEVQHAIANSVSVGIAVEAQSTAGKIVKVAHRAGEIIEGVSGAAFAVDALLTSDANGKLVTAATGNNVAAFAREAATAADQLVAVEVAAPGTRAP